MKIASIIDGKVYIYGIASAISMVSDPDPVFKIMSDSVMNVKI